MLEPAIALLSIDTTPELMFHVTLHFVSSFKIDFIPAENISTKRSTVYKGEGSFIAGTGSTVSSACGGIGGGDGSVEGVGSGGGGGVGVGGISTIDCGGVVGGSVTALVSG